MHAYSASMVQSQLINEWWVKINSTTISSTKVNGTKIVIWSLTISCNHSPPTTPNSVAAWCVSFICNLRLKIRGNVNVCCLFCYVNLTTPHEPPSDYSCVVCYSELDLEYWLRQVWLSKPWQLWKLNINYIGTNKLKA